MAESTRYDHGDDPEDSEDAGDPNDLYGRESRRPHPYTVEGYLLGMGDFATGASGATGWRRALAVAVAWAILIPMGLGVLVGIGRLLSLLLWR